MEKLNRWFDDRERFFWALHSLGWFGWGMMYYLGSLLHEMRDAFVFVLLLNALAGWILSLPLRYLYQQCWNLSPLRLLATVLISSYLLALVWTLVTNFHYWEIYKHGYRPDEWIYYFKDILSAFFIMLCWSGLYFGTKYYQLLQKEKQTALEAATSAHQAHLKMLRYQLNPHFLFNTLNAISTLILIKENDTANKMVTKLSDFLRYSLDKDPINQVPLKQEIKVLKLYLEIEKVRFQERLEVLWQVDEQAQQALVPSMLLQPLIENAIKHAISRLSETGIISISAKVVSDELLVDVADNGPGAQLHDGKLKDAKGVGLANIEARLKATYKNNFTLQLSNNQPNGLKISIRIPFKASKKHGKD